MERIAVVLLPGLLCDEAVWSHQVRTLGADRCRVPAFDDRPSIGAMAERVLAQAPAGPFLLAGHSLGGRVALEVVRRAPERVARLALLDTGVAPLPPGAAGDAERAARLELLAIARRDGMRAMGMRWARGMVHPAHVDTPVFAAILAMIARRTPETFAGQVDALLARPDATAVLAGVRCPTLIACGRQDAWAPPARHEAMHALAPHARLAVIEDSGHMTTMEQPDAVSRLLVEWAA